MTKQVVPESYQLRNNGLDAILISWSEEQINTDLLMAIAQHLQHTLPWIMDLTVSEKAIQLRYNVLHRLFSDAKKDAQQALAGFDRHLYKVQKAKKIRIPVCYHPSLAPDLESVMQQCNVNEHTLSQLHSRAEYRVSMMGFAPGFGYLKGLPDELQLPRLKSPRVSVPKGSVAIAEQYSAVYPQTSPGGWSLIGKTPIRLFDTALNPPCLLSVGATVKFDVIELDEFKAMEQELGSP
jgi:inhibitor of KinA